MKKKTTKDRKKSFGIQNWPYLQNMYAKFHINRIKIEGVITSRVGPKNGAKTGAEKFPTDCFGQINRYERRPSGFMKKMNGGKYRVTRFARDNELDVSNISFDRLSSSFLEEDLPMENYFENSALNNSALNNTATFMDAVIGMEKDMKKRKRQLKNHC